MSLDDDDFKMFKSNLEGLKYMMDIKKELHIANLLKIIELKKNHGLSSAEIEDDLKSIENIFNK